MSEDVDRKPACAAAGLPEDRALRRKAGWDRQQEIRSWAETFETASLETKRSIISALIDRIVVHNDIAWIFIFG